MSTQSGPPIPAAIVWHNNALQLLDQTRLPGHVAYLPIQTAEDVWGAIRRLSVRGAPAIGIAAAYGLVVAMQAARDAGTAVREPAVFRTELARAGAYLKSARPTAVNLQWAVERVILRADAEPTIHAITDEACAIHAEDIQICRAIAENGSVLIAPNDGLLTHCNAGALAVSELGTATAPMYRAHEMGVPFHVYVDETRPLLQGARLTAWELDAAGIATTLICDNMAATLMSQGRIQTALVGTDRVCANGDVVNKIGTLGVAVLCKHFGVPLYVACPGSTYDPHTPTGADVEIEERDAEEVRSGPAAQVPVYNPAFDVTPRALVTGFVTERGVLPHPAAP